MHINMNLTNFVILAAFVMFYLFLYAASGFSAFKFVLRYLWEQDLTVLLVLYVCPPNACTVLPQELFPTLLVRAKL